ncbi:MAG: hypothetical protein A2X96_11000 [Syntrophobacterales bacterium GWC2_56_13]|nr:MAG: hypothetical protein A2X96_11000 [Syntrophobacterales bacterium GWC2_56_13]
MAFPAQRMFFSPQLACSVREASLMGVMAGRATEVRYAVMATLDPFEILLIVILLPLFFVCSSPFQRSARKNSKMFHCFRQELPFFTKEL